MDSYVLDFYLDGHWCKLPTKWSECLNKLNLFDIPWLLGFNDQSKCVLPLTLLCLRSLSTTIRMIRSKPFNEQIFSSPYTKHSQERHQFSENLSTGLDHILTRGIKAKKRHEIQQLCKLISTVMNKFDNNLDIIDFGSGKCHLSRILGICYGFKVFCIEAKSENLNGAIKRENKVLKALEKYKRFNVFEEEMPVKANCFLTKENRIDELFGDKITRPHLLLGLHACGSLSNLVLEEFATNPNSHCLVLACCCYMNSELFRFPMSQLLKENTKFTLSISAKELACHAIEKFLDDFSKKELDSLKVHGYRACLEVLLERYAPEKRYQSMRNVKITTEITFKEYVTKATKGLNISIPESIFESNEINDFINQTDQVILFYSLRLLIAPLIELYILMDYRHYLCEQNPVKNTYLIPLFSPSISPRNFILIANK
ncbi:Ribosomal RNA adenine dimethylase domain-containing protein 1 [Dermatophagoides pteronyssinus]|uniref:Ribosomal RNA adenine dimethylase domain-containing protein 1 n=1 Tax=Dermatophagoides pteronyssinus TaxID=6956 RepID=A0ABQ8ITW5_DERPT|nr:Ribosomal RNA adenine dimethylase domain-containing protein 1 [Dermatophagoides pteronyssinus]